MIKLLFTSALIVLVVLSYSQNLETVQLQIDDLEEAKKNLQDQIDETDTRLVELYKTKHELTLAVADHGFPGYTRNDVEMIEKALRIGQFKSLAFIPKNTLLLVEEYEDGSYKTTYNGITGYIPAYQFKLNDPENKKYLELKGNESAAIRKQQRDEEMKKEADQRKQKSIEAKQKRENAIRKKYTASSAQKILDGKIWIGMTKEMMIDSSGQPEDINRSVGSWVVHEQCIYGDTYVYVENGKVTSWQD